MSRRCEICDKGTMTIIPRKKLRGNYNPTAKSVKKPNLQKVKIDGTKIKVCTRCMKKLNK